MLHNYRIDLEIAKVADRSSTWRQRLILEAWHSMQDRYKRTQSPTRTFTIILRIFSH